MRFGVCGVYMRVNMCAPSLEMCEFAVLVGALCRRVQEGKCNTDGVQHPERVKPLERHGRFSECTRDECREGLEVALTHLKCHGGTYRIRYMQLGLSVRGH